MPGFSYGPWIPDIDDLNSTTAPVAYGCLPTTRGWGPWPKLQTVSDGIPETVRGAFTARTSTGSVVIFAGTETKLYKLSGSTWTDVSRLAGGAYNLPADNYWTWAQQDNRLYAAQAGDPPQWIDIDSGSNFAAITPAAGEGTVPTARYVASVGGFLFLLDLTVPVGSIQPTTGRIQFAWSGYRNPAFWKYGERSCDTGTLPSGGFIMGMSSPETGLLIQQNAVNRFVRVNDRRVWDFAVVEASQGTRSPYSIVEHQGAVYYYGVDGWIVSSAGGASIEGGIEVVDEWFKTNSNQSRLGTIIGALDPTRPRVFWLFSSTGSEDYLLDHIIGFDISLKRFFHAPAAASFIFKTATPGTTLEGLGSAGLGYAMDPGYSAPGVPYVPPGPPPEVPAVPYSLDSSVWQGGALQIGAFDDNQKLAFFSGEPMEALLCTGRIELIPGMRCYVNGWRPQSDAQFATGRIYSAEHPHTNMEANAEAPINPWGVIEQSVSARLMQFETTIPEGGPWTSILGGEFDDDMVKPDGRA